MSDQSVPGIDFARLTPWFREHVEPVGELTAKIVGHGRSNLTYRLEADGQAWVLRRPPLSHVLPTAHDMKREFRVISALEPTDVPVPHAIALCEEGLAIRRTLSNLALPDEERHRELSNEILPPYSLPFGPDATRIEGKETKQMPRKTRRQ